MVARRLRDSKRWISLGARLRQLREHRGQSRAEASRVTGISPNSLVRYEDGSREPGVGAIIKIARAYAVTTDWILLGRDSGAR
jgi:transcriptional regulator with XRE-family HTH domain